MCPRFDVRLEGRSARLRLAEPIDAGCLRLLRLDAELEPFAGRVDMRGGARAFRHRRSTAIEAELDVDLATLLEAASAAGVRVAVGSSDGQGLELVVDDGSTEVRRRVEPEPAGIDLWLRDVGARELGRWFSRAPGDGAVEPSPDGLRVRDPVGWGIREALVPYGFRAPRVTGGSLACRIDGRRLRLSLRMADKEVG